MPPASLNIDIPMLANGIAFLPGISEVHNRINPDAQHWLKEIKLISGISLWCAMKTFKSVTTTLALCLAAVGSISTADAATSSKALTVSAMVTTTCKLVQDHDNLSTVTSFCTNGADFSAASFSQAGPTIQKAESGTVVIF